MNTKFYARLLPVVLLLFTCSAYGQKAAPSEAKPEQHLSKQKVLWTLGNVSIGAFYAGAPYYPSPFFYSAYFYPPPVIIRQPSRGAVKLHATPGDAAVYINGAYAGTANRLKKFSLASGAYDLEVKARDYRPVHRRIYVLSDRTLHIAAHLAPLAPQPGGKP